MTTKKKLIKKTAQPTPENFPDNWDTEWQPSFETATIGKKPAPKFKRDEPTTPPRTLTAAGAMEALKQAAEKYAEAEHTAYLDEVYAGFKSDDCRHDPSKKNESDYEILETAARLSSLLLSRSSEELNAALENYKNALCIERHEVNGEALPF